MKTILRFLPLVMLGLAMSGTAHAGLLWAICAKYPTDTCMLPYAWDYMDGNPATGNSNNPAGIPNTPLKQTINGIWQNGGNVIGNTDNNSNTGWFVSLGLPGQTFGFFAQPNSNTGTAYNAGGPARGLCLPSFSGASATGVHAYGTTNPNGSGTSYPIILQMSCVN